MGGPYLVHDPVHEVDTIGYNFLLADPQVLIRLVSPVREAVNIKILDVLIQVSLDKVLARPRVAPHRAPVASEEHYRHNLLPVRHVSRVRVRDDCVDGGAIVSVTKG